MSTNDEVIAALCTKVEELEARINVLSASAPLAGVEYEVAREQEIEAKATKQAEHERAILAMPAIDRSKVFLKLSTAERESLWRRIASNDARLTFARELSTDAYHALLEVLGTGAAWLAFTLAAPEPRIAARVNRNVAGRLVRTNALAISAELADEISNVIGPDAVRFGGQGPRYTGTTVSFELVETKAAWDLRMAIDPDLAVSVNGRHNGNFFENVEPSIVVEALSDEESRATAIREWKSGTPLPART